MISIVLVTCLLLFVKHIITLDEIKTTPINTIKGLSSISVIMSLMGIYYKFNISYMIYILLLIYILSYVLDHPLTVIFDSFLSTDLLESFQSRPIFNTVPNQFKRGDKNNEVYTLNNLYPHEIKVPLPTLKGESVFVDTALDNSIKKGIENHYWVVNTDSIYNNNTNLDDCKTNTVQVVKNKKQSFAFLNILREKKQMVVIFIIFIVLLYVFTANTNVVLL